jgi:hypothetical protein
MPVLKIFLFSIVIMMACELPCFGDWRKLDVNESLIPQKAATNTFFSRQSNGTLFYLDADHKFIRVKRPDGSLLEFNSLHLAGSDIRFKAKQDDAARKRWFKREPVLWQTTNMKTYDKGIVIFHRGGGAGRSVQFVDDNLKVIRSWEDKSLRGGKIVPEAVAVTTEGVVIARGEKGEILRYDLSGQIIDRLVIPGLFNESRIVEPKPIDELEEKIFSERTLKRMKYHKQFDAKFATKKVAARDKTLPVPKVLSGSKMPTFIKALEFIDNDYILVMDDSKIFEIDSNAGSIEPLNIDGLSFDNDAKLIGMKMEGPYLTIITKKRILTVMLTPGVICEKALPSYKKAHDKVPWDILPPTCAGTFLFPDKLSRSVEKIECDPLLIDKK